jgi:hypothetical protein
MKGSNIKSLASPAYSQGKAFFNSSMPIKFNQTKTYQKGFFSVKNASNNPNLKGFATNDPNSSSK